MPLGTRQVAKSVLPDAGTRMHNHPVADKRMQDRGAGADRTLASDADVRADSRSGRDHGSGADLGAGPDHSERIDGDAGLEPRRGMHLRACRAAAGIEQ